MALVRHGLWNDLIEQTKIPHTIQKRFLFNLLAQNKYTRFGKEHHFSEINSIEEFKKNIPINQYEDLRPYIESNIAAAGTGLTQEHPSLFLQTSGTTDRPKNIPLTGSATRGLKDSQTLFAFAHHMGIPDIFKGKLLTISGMRVEGQLENGKPYGSMSGMISHSMPFLLKSKYVVPKAIARISDYQLKYLMIAALGLKERNITWLVSANPSTFFKILEVMEANLDPLIKLLSTGDASDLPEGFQRVSTRRFRASRDRAQELKTLARNSHLSFSRIWPNLKAVTTWTGGNCALLMPKLRNLLSRETLITELGYIATEFRGSVLVDTNNNTCVPAITESFFEFIEPDHWNSGSVETLTLDQLEIGKQYYVIATTTSGLYRYFINDIIEATGKFNQTPTIRFVQKGKGVTNLTGEKLTEFQVLKAIESIPSIAKLNDNFFLLAGDANTLQYRLYIEMPPRTDIPNFLDQEISNLNLEFAAKQKSGRLLPTKVYFLTPGCGEAYKKHSIAKGQRESQYKTIRLQYLSDCHFDFEPFIISSA